MSPPAHIRSEFSVWSMRNVTPAHRLSFHLDPRATWLQWIPTTNPVADASMVLGWTPPHCSMQQGEQTHACRPRPTVSCVGWYSVPCTGTSTSDTYYGNMFGHNS
jgi:hypothetical protein